MQFLILLVLFLIKWNPTQINSWSRTSRVGEPPLISSARALISKGYCYSALTTNNLAQQCKWSSWQILLTREGRTVIKESPSGKEARTPEWSGTTGNPTTAVLPEYRRKSKSGTKKVQLGFLPPKQWSTFIRLNWIRRRGEDFLWWVSEWFPTSRSKSGLTQQNSKWSNTTQHNGRRALSGSSADGQQLFSADHHCPESSLLLSQSLLLHIQQGTSYEAQVGRNSGLDLISRSPTWALEKSLALLMPSRLFLIRIRARGEL